MIMRPARFPTLLLATICSLLCVTSVTAQTPAASPESPSTEGLQEAVSRQYAPDRDAGEMRRDELYFLTARVYRFDTANHAATAYDHMIASAAAHMVPPEHEGVIDMQVEEIDDLGDQAEVSWLQSNPQDGMQGFFRVIHVRDGELIYLLTAIAGEEESTLIVDDLAQDMTSREPGSNEADFSPDGTSTGGMWELFPDADAEIIKGLVPFSDDHYTAP